MTRHPRALVVALLAAGALAGCSGSSHKASPSPSAPAVTPTASPVATPVETTPPPAADDPGAVLERVALREADLPSGSSFGLMQEGDQVDGQVTLDNCGYDFTTEAHRVARRQYVMQLGSTRLQRSNELVAYDSAARATKALQEVWTSVVSCPKTPTQSNVEGAPPLRTTVLEHRRGVALPVRSNLLAVEKVVGGGETAYAVLVFQQRGRYLDGVYALQQSAPTHAELAAVLRLATITGSRLARV